MTFEPSQSRLPDLTTTRVGGGISARLAAVAVGGLLIGVVGFAVTNRPSPAATGPTVAPAAIAPTPAPTPAPPRNPRESGGLVFGWPLVAEDPSRVFSYAVSMDITGGHLRAVLSQALTEVFTGSVVIESADAGDTLVVEPGRQWREAGLTLFEAFGAWQINLAPLRNPHVGRVALLVVHQPPGANPGVPGPTASGYTFTVLGRRDGTRLTLDMELVWPRAAQFARVAGPRNPDLLGRCRWGLEPLAAPSSAGTNEGDC